jgi:hypothetical protein
MKRVLSQRIDTETDTLVITYSDGTIVVVHPVPECMDLDPNGEIFDTPEIN